MISGDRGRITAEQIMDSINPPDFIIVQNKSGVFRNTTNKGGGLRLKRNSQNQRTM